MNPTPAVALHESAKVVEAAAHMAAKRVDAVLIVDDLGHLSGIITDKDMTFRVVAEGLDPRGTCVSEVMTHNPVSVVTSGAAADALNKMVAGHFRHLPVIEDTPEEPDPHSPPPGVVAVLDITKCLYDALDSLDKLTSTTTSHPARPSSSYATLLKDHLSFPDLSSLVGEEGGTPPPPVVAMGDTVLEAARRMRGGRETAALVFDAGGAEGGLGDLCGIFTSKDLVLRVLAAGLDPGSTQVVRVMTPHPDCVTPDTPVIDALRKMHAGRYLHLPVVDSTGVVEGLVDVLKLTYTTLGQLSTLQSTTTPEGTNLWSRFWDTTPQDSDNDSDVSGRPTPSHISITTPSRSRVGANHPPPQPSLDHHLRQVMTSPSPSNESAQDDSTVLPDDSASRVAADPPPVRRGASVGHGSSSPHRRGTGVGGGIGGTSARGSTLGPIDETAYTFKLRDVDTGKTHRLVVNPCTSLQTLTTSILTRLGPTHPRFPTPPTTWVSLSYIDDEGDTVHLGSDEDLTEAVGVARGAGWSRLMICMDAQVAAVGVGRFFVGGSGVGGSVLSVVSGERSVVSVSERGGGGEGGEGLGGNGGDGGEGTGGGRRRKDGDMEGLIAPVLVGTGVAIVCAFLLGRAFR
ncbi:hypothetical protein HDU67_010010 [Dinochytrium kinnereticum]|nr:hypothetical protein HDU67_010010 [Dinochytrium kinnereticum]